ncbi:adenosylcobinamide-GDP ribazoletransferase [Acetobacter sp. TBRC 12305]|uniref:Adenosylcobinamide-GDP ribazoletransferase n=1 Tax=Acetobacter garciniae TaxID=2817435 RepID=A0A939HQ09_9PROT|nr:adenosylcobinamide-GDP ribazoletransferase [Acetobacter garciniae]MBO1325246.1 adenosylcobinamide-GDP ribazoletransferase [Acetobacter garciniae]MBX0344782.1 adenosylcobinamide-GDP ribazoletransferase [Acetobacter garciniae]
MTRRAVLPALAVLRLHLACGLALLTRLPVDWLLPASYRGGADTQPPPPWPLGRSIWCWPLIGGGVGAVTGCVLVLLHRVHMPPLVAACMALAAQTLLSGALHEDGLADMADAAGGRTRERRLEIMRDSHIGSFGTSALCLAFGIRVAALAALAVQPGKVGMISCILAGVLGRAAMLVLPARLPPARTDGLARALSPLPRAPLGVALASAGALTLWLMTLWGENWTKEWATGTHPTALSLTLAPIIAACLGVIGMAWAARRLLGGYTGDVLGACVVVVECLVLATFAALAA